jgi:tetratricopeptide (TPR) repeat protein
MRRLPSIPALLRKSLALPCLALAIAAACSSTGPTPEERVRQIEVHAEMCAGYLNMGEFGRAEDQAVRGLTLDPENFVLRLYLARALLKQDRMRSILRAEQVLGALDDEGDFRVPLTLGEVLERKGIALQEAAVGVRQGTRYTEAPDPVARALELNADAASTWARAQSNYQRAFELAPSDTEVLNGLVRITSLQGQFEESLTWGQAIVLITAVDREFWKKQLQRTNIALHEEQRMWQNIRRLEALEMAVHLQAAALLNNQLSRPEEALTHIQSIIAFDPEIPESFSQMAQLLVKLERYEEALSAIDSFMRICKEDFDSPDVQRAFRLKSDCEAALARNRLSDS